MTVEIKISKSDNIKLICLQSDWKNNALFNPQFSDFEIVCHGKRFLVSTFILKVRSPVFEAMLKADSIETATKTMKIDDFDENIVQAFLAYLLTDKIDKRLLNFHSKSLFEIACKYEVKDMIDLCVEYCIGNITADSFFTWAEVAEKYDNKKIKKACIRFAIVDGKELVKKFSKEYFALPEDWLQSIHTGLQCDFYEVEGEQQPVIQKKFVPVVHRSGCCG